VTYVDVNGLATWHEVRGQVRPAVLLHGAFAGASSWAAQAPALAAAGSGRWWPCWWPAAARTWWSGWC
jgi:pimeloyl-ACP methyl ester carboxylesterase